MMRKGKRIPALPGVVFCPALEKNLSVRLMGRHRRGSAPMSIILVQILPWLLRDDKCFLTYDHEIANTWYINF